MNWGGGGGGGSGKEGGCLDDGVGVGWTNVLVGGKKGGWEKARVKRVEARGHWWQGDGSKVHDGIQGLAPTG